MDYFSRDYISALRGCWALEFLHTLEINQGLLAHTRRGTLVPPPKKKRENLKFGLKFSVLESITPGIVKVFSLIFFMRPAITARGISSSWNWFCTRIGGAGRPHVWLCHAHLVYSAMYVLLCIHCAALCVMNWWLMIGNNDLLVYFHPVKSENKVTR